MKIMQLLPELNQGGVERGTLELSRELVRRGHTSIVVSAGGVLSDQVERDGGRHVEIDVCSKNPLTALTRARRLRKLILELRPDIVHARSRVPAWLAVFALKKIDIPFVTTVHGFNSVSPYSKVMTRGQRVICVSSSVKDFIRASYDTPEEKIRIVHRGVDLESFSPESLDASFIEAFKARHGLVDRFVVACVGRISPLKNFEAFIEAVRLCSERIPNIKGLIVGGVREDRQAYFSFLQKLAEDLGMDERIAFAGSQSKMAEVYSLCDLVVACSKKPESFGRSLVEAMAMDTPVISVARGGPLDIIDPGRTGLLCPDESPEQIAACIRQARQTSFADLRKYVTQKFSLNTMVEKELQVYKELVKK